MTDLSSATSPDEQTRRDDYLAGLDLERLRPDAITAFVASLPDRTGQLIARVLEHEEASGASAPAAAEAARSAADEIRTQLEALDADLDDAGLPTRPGKVAERHDTVDDPAIEPVGQLADTILGRLSTASSGDWTSGDPTLLERARTAVGELGWLLHVGGERVEGHLSAP